MSAMHKLVYKMYLEKIEAMEKDKDAMMKLIADPNEEFEDEEEVEDEDQENSEANVADVQADGELFLFSIISSIFRRYPKRGRRTDLQKGATTRSCH